MIRIYKKLMLLLDKKQKRAMVGLVFMMLIGAVLEAAGISAVIPVIQVVLDENALEKYAYVRAIYDALHMKSQMQFTIFVLVLLAIVFAIKNIY